MARPQSAPIDALAQADLINFQKRSRVQSGLLSFAYTKYIIFCTIKEFTAGGFPMKQSEDQIMRVAKSSLISCACARCALTVADGRATNYIRCGCSDCRTAFTWGHSNGGSEPDFLPHLYYLPSDILDVRGRDNLAAYKLRNDGQSIRVYCNSCFSLIGADHAVYKNNVFMISPKHCNTDCDLSIRLTAHLFMSEYPLDYPDPTTDAFLFHSFRFEQERKSFFALPAVQEAFREPEKAPTGETFRELIETLDKPTILNI